MAAYAAMRRTRSTADGQPRQLLRDVVGQILARAAAPREPRHAVGPLQEGDGLVAELLERAMEHTNPEVGDPRLHHGHSVEEAVGLHQQQTR